MKRIFIILSVLLLLGIIYFCTINFHDYINIKVIYSSLLNAQTMAGWTEQGAYYSRAIRFSTYTVLVQVLFICSLTLQKIKLKLIKEN